MDPLFVCPPPVALTPIPDQNCPVRFDQINRMMFQRKQAVPSFTEATILTEAPWTAAMEASDDELIVGTPLFSNFVIPVGEILKEGGNDNTTINGIPKLSGLGFVPVTLQLQDISSAVINALSKLTSESALQPGFTNLWVYFINRYGQVIYNKSGSNAAGFDVYNFAVGDTGSEGFNKPNITPVSFDFAPGWSRNAAMLSVPAFSLLNKKAA